MKSHHLIKHNQLLKMALIVLAVCLINVQALDTLLNVYDEIRTEALRNNNDTIGLPLPLFARCGSALWNGTTYDTRAPFHPDSIVTLIQQGHYIMPFVQGWTNGWEESTEETAVRWFALKKLPLSITVGQPECELLKSPYNTLSLDSVPAAVNLDGTLQGRLSPFGAAWPWREYLQKMVTNHPNDDPPNRIKTLQLWYPQPPRIVWFMNNECGKIGWPSIETEKRYVDKYGLGRTDSLKCSVMADGWARLYSAFRRGMRDSLTKSWGDSSIIVGYNAFIHYHYGLDSNWGGWRHWSMYVPGRFLDGNVLQWEGASPEYYANDWNESTDHTVWGPQVGTQSFLMAKKDALRLNPNFWFEMCTWDGSWNKRKVYVAQDNKPYTVDRYKGFMQFGMWLNRPRILREFQFYDSTHALLKKYSMGIIQVVDTVHTDTTLRKFWRKGRLLPHPTQRHPWQTNICGDFRDSTRWFMLDCNANPAYPWSNKNMDVPVFAIALELGAAPRREWLIVAYAPRGDRNGVKLFIPGYDTVTTNVKVGGSLVHVIETGATQTGYSVLRPEATSGRKVRLVHCNNMHAIACQGPDIVSMELFTVSGKRVPLDKIGKELYALPNNLSGMYLVFLTTTHGTRTETLYTVQ